jgi:hypothetical protein
MKKIFTSVIRFFTSPVPYIVIVILLGFNLYITNRFFNVTAEHNIQILISTIMLSEEVEKLKEDVTYLKIKLGDKEDDPPTTNSDVIVIERL